MLFSYKLVHTHTHTHTLHYNTANFTSEDYKLYYLSLDFKFIVFKKFNQKPEIM